MSSFPSVTGKDLIKALNKFGFKVIRIKGSYHFLRHDDGRCSVVPVHKNETIGKGLLAQILRDCEISRQECVLFCNRIFKQKLTEAGIDAAIHYSWPLHLQKAYDFMELGKGSFPVAERAGEQVMSLPITWK